MSHSMNMISDITPLKENWKIKVKIIRIWEKPDYYNKTEIKAIEMVLVDEKVFFWSKIQAIIKKSLTDKFKNLMKEGSSRIIANFGVESNLGKHRPTIHTYRINFFYKTIVKECGDDALSLHGLELVSFDKILQNEIDDTILVDVIGEVTGIGDMVDKSTTNIPIWFLPLEIEDMNNKTLKCALWGKYAQQMVAYKQDESHDGRVVVVIQFAQIKVFKGEVSILNSLFATKILVNEDIPEMNEFKKSIADGDCHSSRLTHLSSQSSHSISDEFLVLSERIQLDEICKQNKECSCVVLASIISIETETKWYYNSCKLCNKKVDYEGGEKFWCSKYDSHVKSAPPRYKVTVTVEDDNGYGTFIIFDREIFQILQISAVDLKNKSHKYNLEQDWDKYTVLKISDDEQLIKQFMEVNPIIEEHDVEVVSSNESIKTPPEKEIVKELCP
ncbi:replication protein A 70 kDa DNA-binding subunit B-like [Spinacia oleracea]|uniref:Replication protein A 70 kDa DNA-binding subunit B-like n=1 Tax=Spinacia oleracea TaxID=3562 RepID=A0ABM3QWT8_SPIOL|nr:replication protein A 70 kDa DNA-binding subunit B-like [Spinacia oleracea]